MFSLFGSAVLILHFVGRHLDFRNLFLTEQCFLFRDIDTSSENGETDEKPHSCFGNVASESPHCRFGDVEKADVDFPDVEKRHDNKILNNQVLKNQILSDNSVNLSEKANSNPSVIDRQNDEQKKLMTFYEVIVPFEIYESGVTESFEIAIPEYGRVPNSRREMLFRQLLDFSRREDLYSEALPACSMALLLMELTQEHIDGVNGSRSSISPVIVSSREWIKSNCHRQLSASDIAAEFHYNTEYFSALFKKETGMPLIGFLNKCRIEVAKNLLSSENVSIKEAAFSCGFNDEKYFMKMFRKHEGMTPMQYKNYFLVK